VADDDCASVHSSRPLPIGITHISCANLLTPFLSNV
jgi:hypothetical protein